MHIWGIKREPEVFRGEWSGEGCPTVKAWASEKGLWDEEARWRGQMFHPRDDEGVKKLAKFVATLPQMYRWHWYGGAPSAYSGSTHFEMRPAGFRWAWDMESSAPSSAPG
jgi:hypothetical protein